MRLWTKNEIATGRSVTPRCVDNWRARGLLDQPIKLGDKPQSRVRWTDEQVANLDRRLTGTAA